MEQRSTAARSQLFDAPYLPVERSSFTSQRSPRMTRPTQRHQVVQVQPLTALGQCNTVMNLVCQTPAVRTHGFVAQLHLPDLTPRSVITSLACRPSSVASRHPFAYRCLMRSWAVWHCLPLAAPSVRSRTVRTRPDYPVAASCSSLPLASPYSLCVFRHSPISATGNQCSPSQPGADPLVINTSQPFKRVIAYHNERLVLA